MYVISTFIKMKCRQEDRFFIFYFFLLTVNAILTYNVFDHLIAPFFFYALVPPLFLQRLLLTNFIFSFLFHLVLYPRSPLTTVSNTWVCMYYLCSCEGLKG